MIPLIVLSVSMVFGPYQASLVTVKDGDTVVLDLYVWPGQTNQISVRELGIDTPEKRTRNLCEKELGYKATNFTIGFLANKHITVENVEYGKYAGRVLGNIYADGESLSEALLSEGLAVKYDGGKKSEWCKEEK